jgi:hypothetical protein
MSPIVIFERELSDIPDFFEITRKLSHSYSDMAIGEDLAQWFLLPIAVPTKVARKPQAQNNHRVAKYPVM